MGVTRIQHNLSAMNAMSNYQGNSGALTNNLEKLSSGYRINSAADDAAGLAISEKMRSQIAGLQKAQDNANDGISLVQTAEGALTEVNSMLTRLKSLATQSANGTYEDGVDRLNIQEETNALLDEIDRISQSTNFNGIQLLDGSLDGKSQVDNVALTETVATVGKFELGDTAGIGKGTAVTFGTGTGETKLTKDDIGKSVSYTVTWKDSSGNQKTSTAKLTFMGQGDGTVANLNDTTSIQANYFVDDQGTKYNIGSDKKLSSDNIMAAIKAGLENDKDFSANFKVSIDNSVSPNTDTGKLTIETKNNGEDTAKVVGGAASGNFVDETVTSAMNVMVAGDTNTANVAQKAQSAYQRFNVKQQSVVTTGATAKDIKASTFELDGSKFLLVDSNWTDDDTKALDSDINVIKLQTIAVASGTKQKVEDATGYPDDVDGQEIAAVIQQKTGRTVEYKTATDESNAADGQVMGNSGIVEGDIVFKDTNNKLKTDGNELSLQIGDTNKDYQKVSVVIQDMSSKGLGLEGLDLSNQEAAGNAVDTIQNAINAVSTQRGQLGALQNRLDHTLNSLDATEQNITAAESQIRDVDMAKEMTQYSKNNILVQAAQSMLAQANSLPQGVLSLLQ
jgi:flagellin